MQGTGLTLGIFHRAYQIKYLFLHLLCEPTVHCAVLLGILNQIIKHKLQFFLITRMSSVPLDKLSPGEVQQLAISYAAFVLGDAGAKVNAANLQAVLDAAGIKVEKAWLTAFSKVLESRPLDSFFSVGGGAEAESAPAPAAKTTAAPPKEDKKKEDKKETKNAPPPPPPPPADDDAGMDMGGLFDM